MVGFATLHPPYDYFYMNAKVKLQHYVPQCYLSSFVIKPKKDSIYCYRKSDSRSFVTSIRNVASESYFYDGPTDANQEIEETLGEIESSFKPVLRRIIYSEDLGVLALNEKQSLAYLAVAQELRTREYRETMKDKWKQVKERLYKEELTDEFKERYNIDELGSEQQSKVLQSSIVQRIPAYAEIILQMKWILLINRTPIPLWCSDQPINRYNPIEAKFRGNLGLLSKGIELHFPLSPNMVLLFTDPVLNSQLSDRYEMTDVQNITFENSLQVFHSTRYIFSKNNDFSLADKILRDDPSLRKIDRKRIQIR